ncbi:zinc finger BED domain-containing protein RICESLEEPER 2-like [Telopea speciosissima]|uniref:zinc finger BED domain-containing protein RICESLEEPER 2-like n=1 Tax=Telopea speciosissima TaxID=54955 RepID=UPI001CC50E54|nr:zinc finger BED domain-containing protein RICESLEEPER 2-like [Telopea speciosissima]
MERSEIEMKESNDDGIKLIDKAVQKVRDSVKFVKSSQARKVRFAESCGQIGLNTKRGLHGDVSTRWNSTFQMLDDVLFCRQAFDNFENLESNYRDLPTEEEWAKIQKITNFLKPFEEITKQLPGSKNPTSNLYFVNVVHIYMRLNDGSLFERDFMLEMVSSMREKFNKYWVKYSLILSVGVVFDPCYKLGVIEWAYEEIHGDDKLLIDESVDRVEDPFTKWSNRKKPIADEKSELDQYLAEDRKPSTEEYDVLIYWKGCEGQYPDLSWLARGILAILVSTVASESTFSAGLE